MYYQSIVHQVVETTGIDDLVAKLKGPAKAQAFQALLYRANDTEFYFVNDAHIDDPVFSETAALVKIKDNFFQFESLSIYQKQDTLKFLADTVGDFNPKRIPRRPTQLLINTVDKYAMANFTCGCCGSNFNSNVKKQLAYGQDNGYGICVGCEQYY